MRVGKLSVWAGVAVCSVALAGMAHRGKVFADPAVTARQATESQQPQAGAQTNAPPVQNSQQPAATEQNPFAQTENEKSQAKKPAKPAPPPPLYTGRNPGS